MSMPISGCLISKAACGDEEAYKELIDVYTTNMKYYGHWTTFACRCDPPCAEPTKEQIDELDVRVNKYFKENPVESEADKYCPAGSEGTVGYKKNKEK